MEKVLITGGNGFVAQQLALLLAEKYKTVVTGKGPSRVSFNNPHIIYREMDITAPEACINVITQESPDFIVHTAAISKPDECENDQEKAEDINVSGTKYLLEAASQLKNCFFIFLSSDFVFSGEDKGMYAEDDLPSPVNYYGLTKLVAEKEVEKYAGGWSIVRTVLVYGETNGGRDNILTMAVKTLKKGAPIKIVNDQVRTPTYVGDLCKGINLVIEKRAHGIFHISGKNVLTPYQMVIAAAKFLGLDEQLVTPVTEKDFSQPARRPLKTGFIISKAERELGYKPVSFEEGLGLMFLKFGV
jgi:dTDP-4-dehydrorhamnose reductase